MTTNGEKLRAVLSGEGVLVLPGVHDCISARLAEAAGFEAAFTSGFGISASTLGRPDFGFLTATEMLASVSRIVSSVGIPVVADIDTGYGNPLNVMRTVEDVVSAGAAGIILEARGASELVIIGRTDARAVNGLEDAIRRGRIYYESGADVVFIEAPQSVEELREIAAAFPDAPLFANMVEGGRTPLLSAAELGELGFKIVVFPLSGLFSATKAMERCLTYLRKNGSTYGYSDMLTFREFEAVVDVPGYRALEKKFTIQKQDKY